jgi:LPXTG-motif cell wall-anchored protein
MWHSFNSKGRAMKTNRIMKWAAGGAMGAVVLFGGTVGAADYPPSDTTATTVAVGGVSGFVAPAAAPAAAPTAAAAPAVAGQLPATGSDNDLTIKLAGGAIIAGGGLLAAAKLRRRPTTAA